ncbi:hypothetical protein ACQV5M_19225 [Leptospira sp. SA-E8]|uniref:hypothetical protein n=1 Tax=Leptospira sp. SA-E8 TaxID=3422259 RepID=UPI003EB9327C
MGRHCGIAATAIDAHPGTAHWGDRTLREWSVLAVMSVTMRSLLHFLSLPLIIHRAVAVFSAFVVFALLFAAGEVALHARMQERANQH